MVTGADWPTPRPLTVHVTVCPLAEHVPSAATAELIVRPAGTWSTNVIAPVAGPPLVTAEDSSAGRCAAASEGAVDVVTPTSSRFKNVTARSSSASGKLEMIETPRPGPGGGANGPSSAAIAPAGIVGPAHAHTTPLDEVEYNANVSPLWTWIGCASLKVAGRLDGAANVRRAGDGRGGKQHRDGSDHT